MQPEEILKRLEHIRANVPTDGDMALYSRNPLMREWMLHLEKCLRISK